MWKYICTGLMLLGQHSLSAQTTISDNLVTGSWRVTRWETEDRLLDFEDSVASINFMVDRWKKKNNLQAVSATDSTRIRAEVRKVLPAAEALRFWLLFNKDKTFTWSRGNSDTSAAYKGTYSLSSTNEIVLTSVDGRTNAYQKMSLKLHAIHSNELIIEIPSQEAGAKQSKFTLKRIGKTVSHTHD